MTKSRTAEWAAGLFEGEGGFDLQWHKKGKSVGNGAYTRDHHYARAQLAMTDEDEVREFHAVVGVGNLTGPHGPYGAGAARSKPHWKWNTSTYAGTAHIAMLLAPWLGQRRLVQAINALAADTRRKS